MSGEGLDVGLRWIGCLMVGKLQHDELVGLPRIQDTCRDKAFDGALSCSLCVSDLTLIFIWPGTVCHRICTAVEL